jgi:hypothetical protein
MLISWNSAPETRWDTFCNLMVRHVVRYYCSGTNERAFSDGYSSENDGTASDRSAAFYACGYNPPIFVGL